MHLLVMGNPVEGFVYHGPFPSEDQALNWGIANFPDGEDWWPAKLESPDPEFNDDQPDAEAKEVPIEELEAALGLRFPASKKLPKQVMIDLSVIHEAV